MLVMMSRKVDDVAASEESAPTSWQLSLPTLCLYNHISSQVSVAYIKAIMHMKYFQSSVASCISRRPAYRKCT